MYAIMTLCKHRMAQTPTITSGKPEASKARASGSLGRALGHLGSPWGAQTATLGRCPTTPVVISHPRTRTMGRIKWTGGDRSLMDGSLPQAAPFADIGSSDPLHLILTSPIIHWCLAQCACVLE